MGVRIGDLDRRQIERLRIEIVETLAANFAYPPFFDFRTNRMLVRPIDKAKRNEIEQYVQGVKFSTFERLEVTSPDLRHFIERLFQRYVEANTTLAHSRFERFLPGLRAHASRMASQIQRNLIAHLDGGVPSFGAPRQRQSWSGAPGPAAAVEVEETEHNTRVLEATLLRRPGDAPGPYVPLTRKAGSSQQGNASVRQGSSGEAPPSPSRSASMAEPAAPVSAANSPYATASGRIPGAGPLRLPDEAAKTGDSGTKTRNIPSDLMQLYGEYLSDMQPEIHSSVLQQPGGPGMPHLWSAGAAGSQQAFMPGASQSPVPAVQESGALSEEIKSDKLIFWQLRYQLEAYIRRAARSYGVQAESDDPFGILDSLRRSGFVDESDLQIAEGIFAITDKITAGSWATMEDYRQAFMLYLLYHRSHLGS
jgi:hypothetical protein